MLPRRALRRPGAASITTTLGATRGFHHGLLESASRTGGTPLAETVGRITSLHRYPVKSMGGEQLAEALVTLQGIAGDRSYAFVQAVAPIGPVSEGSAASDGCVLGRCVGERTLCHLAEAVTAAVDLSAQRPAWYEAVRSCCRACGAYNVLAQGPGEVGPGRSGNVGRGGVGNGWEFRSTGAIGSRSDRPPVFRSTPSRRSGAILPCSRTAMGLL